jgi:chaperonin cofactor prefoldin
MALDTTDTMRLNDPQGLLPQAAAVMVHLLEEHDSLGLLRFDEAAGVVLEPGPLTQVRRRRGLRQLAQLTPQGEKADLAAALDAALEAFSEMPAAPRRALVLITDGRVAPHSSSGDAASPGERLQQTIIPAYQRAGIAIYPVAFPSKADQEILQELAADTGGRFFPVDRPADLHQTLFRVYETIRSSQLAPLIRNRFSIDRGVTKAVIIATRQAGERPVSLTDPLGRQLTPKDASGQVNWFAAPGFDLVKILRPRPGVWSLEGCEAGAGKVALQTNLRLVCPHLPAEVGSDEELVVGAMVVEGGRTLVQTEPEDNTVFGAELTSNGGEACRLVLEMPPVDQRAAWPPGARVGRFPPVRKTGTVRLRVRVISQTFQRELDLAVRVLGPWYREVISSGANSALGRLTLLPTAKAPSGEMQGWFSLQPMSGGLAALLFKASAPGILAVAFPPDNSLPLGVDLRLTGTAPSGRPLVIRPAIPSIQAASPADQNTSPSPGKPGIFHKLRKLAIPQGPAGASLKPKKSWLLAALVAWFVVFSAGALWLVRGSWSLGLLPRGKSGLLAATGATEQERLLSARMETLEMKRKTLQGELDQVSASLQQAAAESAELAEKLEQQTLDFQDKAKVVGELEGKLEEVEIEAKAIQQEYRALNTPGPVETGSKAKG